MKSSVSEGFASNLQIVDVVSCDWLRFDRVLRALGPMISVVFFFFFFLGGGGGLGREMFGRDKWVTVLNRPRGSVYQTC